MRNCLKGCLLAAVAFVLYLFVFQTSAQAASESDLTFTLNSDNASYCVTDCNEAASGELVIPATYNGKPVTIIGNDAFRNCTSLISVTIPDCVSKIGFDAFSGCSSLESMTIPFVGQTRKTSSDTYQYPFGYIFGTSSYIGGVRTQQYYYGYSTTSTIYDTYYIPSTLKSVTVTGGDVLYGAFYNCSNLTSITIPDSVTKIGVSAFYCTGLTEFSIPESVTTVGSSAFAKCRNLTGVIIPDGVTTIGDSAFYNCTSLTSIAFPDSVEKIGSGAMYGCASLESIVIPFVGNRSHSATDINQYPFGYIFGEAYGETEHLFYVEQSYHGDWPAGTTVVGSMLSPIKTSYYGIPKSLKTVTVTGGNILRGAFQNCTGLTTINLPEGLQSIEPSAFLGCSGLTEITIPSSVQQIKGYAFDGCTGLEKVNITDLSAWCAIIFEARHANPLYYCGNLYLNGSLITELIVPEDAQCVKAFAFAGATGLTSATIPDSVQYIENDAFAGCSSLETLTLPYVGYDVTSNGYLGRYFGYESYSGAYSARQDRYTYYIPSSLHTVVVTGGNISDGAFKECRRLTSVVLPDGLSSIERYAFYECTSLSSINIPDSVKTIEFNAFYNCKALTQISIPDSVHSVAAEAFRYCENLSKISIGNGVVDIGADAFYGCSNLIYNSYKDARYLGNTENPYHVYIGTTDNTIENGEMHPDTKVIAYDAFFCYDNLKYVSIPDGVCSIGSEAFLGCTSLTAVDLPVGLKIIGNKAFAGCTGLTEIELPAELETINQGAFQSCTGLTSVVIPGGIETIAGYAFADCVGLKEITLSNSLKVIDYCAFMNCDNLTDITIPDSVTTIGLSAFAGCDNLENVTIGKGVQSIGSEAFRNCVGLESVSIPGNVQEIGNKLFYDCTGLTSATICNGVQKTGSDTFYGCTSLKKLTIPFVGGSIKDSLDSNQYPFGYLFGTEQYSDSIATEQYYYSSVYYDGTSYVKSKTSRTFYIPESLKSVTVTGGYILYGAFYNCTGLTTLKFEADVKGIAEQALYGCSNLESLTVPYTSEGVGRFFGTQSFTNSVSVSRYAVSTKYYIPQSLTHITVLRDILLYEFYGHSRITSAAFGEGVKNIRGYAFKGCYNLKAVLLPESLEIVESYSFDALQHVFYRGSEEQRNSITMQGNEILENAVWHYEVEDRVFAGQECYYCPQCDNYFLPNGGYAPATVTFQYEDGTVIRQEKLSYKSEVVPPEDPEVPESLGKAWRFVGWDKEITACTGDVTYTAVFALDDTEYTITFQNDDGSVISSVVLHLGDSVIAPESPFKAADKVYTYTFAGWDKEVIDCEGDATYTATYTPSYIDYTVVFKNWNGSVITTQTYHYGDKVNVPFNPTKPSDNTYNYDFAGWDKEVVNCEGDTTYTATYTSIYKDYTVTFKNWDGTVISSNTYHWGDQVTAPSNPTRPADNTYTYTFAGWHKEIVNCSGNTTYHAIYTSSYREYTVTFKDWNGTVISSETYHLGDKVTTPADPTRAEDNTYTYVFAGWDKTVVDCEANATYTATYASTYKEYTVVFKNWDGSEISSASYHWGDTVTEPEKPVRPNTEGYSYTFTGWDQEITSCDGDKIYTATYNSWKFSDVSTSSWQISAVMYVCDNGLMAGKGKDANGNIIFDPNSPITREEFVQVLYNAEGKPSVNFVYNFLDVVNGAWYENAVLWAKKNDIANGTPDGNFGVGKNITRQDLALMLYKYAAMKGLDLTAPAGQIDQYADGSSVSGYAQIAMNWAVKNGVLSGKGTAGADISTFRLDPTGTATRAECAAMLKNFMTAFGL